MRAQILKISGHKNLKDFYAEFPDEASFMKKHGQAFEKAANGTRMKHLSYGDYYDDIDSEITGSTAAKRYAAMMAAQPIGGGSEKKGTGLGEMMGMAKTAYSMYQGFGGGSGGDASSMMSSFGSGAGSGAASGMGSSMGSMGSSMMSMFSGRDGMIIPKAQTGIELSQSQFGPQEQSVDTGASGGMQSNWYDNNNPYFMTNPGVQNQPAVGGDINPAGPQAVDTMNNKTVGGADAANAPQNSFTQLPPVENKLGGWGKAAKKIDFLGISGKLITGIGAIKAEKEEKRRARQRRDVSQLALKAAASTDIDAQRMQTDARTSQRDVQMPVNTGEEFFPIYGNNTNVLAKDGIEIKPENRGKFTEYKKRTGKTTEESLHSKDPHVRQMANFARNAAKWDKAQTGAAVSGAGGAATGVASGGGTPWGMIGAAGSGIAGQATGNNAGGSVGGTVGGAIGSIWGPAGRAIGQIAGTAIGGLVDTNPKKTKKFNAQTDINMRGIASIGMGEGIQNQYQSYVEYGGRLPKYEDGGALDGQLQTHWGGDLETISENPYLPNGGETAMFVGDSHDDGGIGATYAGTSVEAEGGEPVVELPDGQGGNSAVVFGNLKISKDSANILGDKNSKNKKFKTYVADLSKKEAASMKKFEESMTEYSEFNPITSFDKLKANTLKLNMTGADMTLKSIAEKKQKAADLQSSINETAEEYGLSAEDLAVGKYKKLKQIKGKAQTGANLPEDSNYQEPNQYYENNPPYFMTNPGNYYQQNNPYFMDEPGPIVTQNTVSSVPTSNGIIGNTTQEEELKKADKYKPYMEAFNQVLPFLRTDDAEDLDNNQLTGEMYALSHNKIEPVYAKGYSPMLDVPYDISLQDIRNENQADFRSAQRMMGYNPAAQANLTAQKYAANQKIGAEEFRMNQAKRDQVFNSNRAQMNDAQLKNLGIYDQQYTRQSQAKSNTKAITQAALNSISDKFAKNKLENRTLQVYENLYNYRFDKNYKAINENPLAIFDTQLKDSPNPDNQSEVERISDMEDQIDEYKKARRDARKKPKLTNGAMISSLKRI
jgi:hypothetical protein